MKQSEPFTFGCRYLCKGDILGVSYHSQHHGLASETIADFRLQPRNQHVVIDSRRQLLVNVVVVESSRPSKGCAKVVVKAVRAPKRTPTTFRLHLVLGEGVYMAIPVQPNGYRQASNSPE